MRLCPNLHCFASAWPRSPATQQVLRSPLTRSVPAPVTLLVATHTVDYALLFRQAMQKFPILPVCHLRPCGSQHKLVAASRDDCTYTVTLRALWCSVCPPESCCCRCCRIVQHRLYAVCETFSPPHKLCRLQPGQSCRRCVCRSDDWLLDPDQTLPVLSFALTIDFQLSGSEPKLSEKLCSSRDLA